MEFQCSTKDIETMHLAEFIDIPREAYVSWKRAGSGVDEANYGERAGGLE